MVLSVWLIVNIFLLVAANMISMLWSMLLILHTHVCRCVKLIQVK